MHTPLSMFNKFWMYAWSWCGGSNENFTPHSIFEPIEGQNHCSASWHASPTIHKKTLWILYVMHPIMKR